ncbi:2-desacetyl-2-hydroxyethyl bacteriochlorophyllide A dehydrogenase [Mycobacterium frederiksbergense]|uniref:2-desacetyl-2-hydroxyethyl bacteriochlorophyllide A dehydrogenase n=1 Tax=Mycolicibacterium frederiksbergense TaxID=117567 RepID=A0ABT6L7W7_9MYCO|nr:alcohol dehydrogenase catalytic domain-containing protein [Mycolicibacterium frederiksbergense]MDH6199048.1 2-desacetyl-2-hydroxyethyl bacteriochlorophyllide A dehydrogenase [Mycolicibacterium frederiksbergense]
MSCIADPGGGPALTTALLLSENLSLTVGTRELSDLADGDVLVDVDYAGICGSDLHVLQTGDWVAYWPATLGHEVAGRVRQSRHASFTAGEAVVADSRIPSRVVDGRQQSDRLAEDLQWLGEARPGGYAGAMVIPGDSLYRVPPGLSTADAVLAEPLAVVMCAIDQLPVENPETVGILGYGPIGALAHAEVARRWPHAAVTVAEPNPQRAELARTQGARVGVLTETDRYSLLIDAAGYDGSLEAAIAATAFGGSILLIALGHASATVLPATIVEHSLHVVGSVGFDDHHVNEALAALAEKPERYNAIVTHTVDLAEIPAFMTDGGMREAIKVLIRCAS